MQMSAYLRRLRPVFEGAPRLRLERSRPPSPDSLGGSPVSPRPDRPGPAPSPTAQAAGPSGSVRRHRGHLLSLEVAAPDPSSVCTVETLRTIEAFESLESEWNLLVEAMPRPSPYLLHGWLAEWWRHFGAGAELAVVIARRDGGLVGAAPLFVRRSGGVRVARFLGGNESALADLLLAAGEERSTGRLLVDEMLRQPFDYADLFGVPEGSVLAVSGGPPLIERIAAPVLVMDDGWDAAYMAKSGPKYGHQRREDRRRLRRLGEVGAVEFVLAETREELEPLLEEAFRLHALRWRRRRDESTFGTEAGHRFERAALRRLAGDGCLRMVLMRVGGRPTAFVYFFVLHGVMVVHRLGFDPALARYGPGRAATLEALRRASDEGLTRVEFLGGADPYKLELASRLEPLSEAVGLARNPLGSLAVRGQLGLIELRKTLSRSERLRRLYVDGLGLLRKSRRPTGGGASSSA
jgi:CelD/BcsL family acetyltransferase involved in cellulose biosynthesis